MKMYLYFSNLYVNNSTNYDYKIEMKVNNKNENCILYDYLPVSLSFLAISFHAKLVSSHLL